MPLNLKVGRRAPRAPRSGEILPPASQLHRQEKFSGFGQDPPHPGARGARRPAWGKGGEQVRKDLGDIWIRQAWGLFLRAGGAVPPSA
jgi:hypothetical protein